MRNKSNKYFYSAENLPSYKPLPILLRIGIISLVAVVVLISIAALIGENGLHSKIPAKYFVFIITIYIALTESQILFDNILEKIFPVPNKIRLRLTIQLIAGILFMFFAIKGVTALIDEKFLDNVKSPSGFYLGTAITVFIVYATANTLLLIRLSSKWLDSQRHIDTLKQKQLLMEYNSLQDQLNPHFLFNNLSVLKSLIIYDSEAAVKFTENFTDVYRYVLQSKNKMLINLSSELEFIEAYIGLHKERLGEGLLVHFSIDKEYLHRDIAPLTLQLLVENAIKHNICSTDEPLTIEIKTENDTLIVGNNTQIRDASYSTKTGLTNLHERYNFLTDNGIEIKQNDKSFEVFVPLI